MENKRKELHDLCEKTNTSEKGIEYLINYYINSLGWTEEAAIDYAIGLFKNDTVQQIKILNSDGEIK